MDFKSKTWWINPHKGYWSWKGKTQTKPVSYRKGGRRKNMAHAATPEMNSRSIWGPAPKEFGGLAKASRIYESKQSNYSINDQNINYRSMIEIDGSDQVKISSLGDESFILLLQARPINEPIVKYGPFVMNNRKEIEEAFEDYNRGGFGDWDWPDSGPVHGRKYKKFAIGDN